MNSKKNRKFLNKSKNIERGSITLFTLISIIFFLIIAIGIYIKVSNQQVSQTTEISKIKSEYEISKEQMNEKYEKIIDDLSTNVTIEAKKFQMILNIFQEHGQMIL